MNLLPPFGGSTFGDTLTCAVAREDRSLQGAGEVAEDSATRYCSVASRTVDMRTTSDRSSVASFVGNHQGSMITAPLNTTRKSSSVQTNSGFGGASQLCLAAPSGAV